MRETKDLDLARVKAGEGTGAGDGESSLTTAS
jgi:MHS family alpha-ketoglutarate permease-like MFS transporter